MINNLHLLYPAPLYPNTAGGSLRSLPIAKLALDCFEDVAIFATNEKVEYEGHIDDVRIVQAAKFKNSLEKLNYFAEGIFSRNFSLKVPKSALYNKNTSLFQLEGPYFYNFLKKERISKFVLDEHNVYWELLKFPSNNPKEILYNKIACSRDKKIEVDALNAASQILVCSERDKQLIIAQIPHIADKITVIPNCVFARDYSEYMMHSPIKDEENNPISVLFVGTLSYAPNIDAVSIICSQIAPHFGDEIQFHIVGKNPPNISSKPSNVTFLGYVDNIKECILRSDICIAPLRYGSGTRFKILEYMAMGKPVISTSKGAEGIDYTNNKNIVIEDDLNMFSEKIRILLDDKKMRDNLGKNAMDLIKQKYDWEIYRKTLHDVYESCM